MSAGYGVHRVHVGRFCGPERADGGPRRMVSLYAVTGLHGDGGEPLELTPDQAIQVANTIVLAAQDTELTEYVIRNAGSEDDSEARVLLTPVEAHIIDTIADRLHPLGTYAPELEVWKREEMGAQPHYRTPEPQPILVDNAQEDV